MATHANINKKEDTQMQKETQQVAGLTSHLTQELGFLIKILFCVFLFASTTYAGSGSKPRDCIYIETGLKVKEERRGDGQIDDCLIQNKEIYAKAVARCQADFYCLGRIREAETLKYMLWFLIPLFTLLGAALYAMFLDVKET